MDNTVHPKVEDQADLRHMAELFDESANQAEARLGKYNLITQGERRSAELFRLAAGALDLHWAAEEVYAQGVDEGKRLAAIDGP